MSNYLMEIQGDINSKEYSNIYNYISIIDINDKFTIIFKKEKDVNFKLFNSMLLENSFEIKKEGYNNKGLYYIKALKIR